MRILELIDEARAAGARLRPCCQVLGLDVRTVQRWRLRGGGEDRRYGPPQEPRNKLSAQERKALLSIANSPEFRDKPPKQIVPTLADRKTYIASESTFYRTLREEGLQHHRGRAKAPSSKPPAEYRATGPNQVWSWDITYLRAPVVGMFFYLYLFMDVWSRKIVAHAVYERECSTLASELFTAIIEAEGLDGAGIVVHQDNGSPMKGATLKATLEKLGMLASYSRPHVSDDNPYSESLFRTLKYRPVYPKKPFESLEAAQAWVRDFVAWYNHEHLHSSIGFVTPAARHDGKAQAILAQRKHVYRLARERHPERWANQTRAWEAPQEVFLNPSKETRLQIAEEAPAAS